MTMMSRAEASVDRYPFDLLALILDRIHCAEVVTSLCDRYKKVSPAPHGTRTPMSCNDNDRSPTRLVVRKRVKGHGDSSYSSTVVVDLGQMAMAMAMEEECGSALLCSAGT